MERAVAHPLPSRDPVTGGALVITELEGPDSGVTIRGRFEMPRFARLSPDQSRYLETFLRCRGMLNSVEKELGISYPTARARLDAVLRALDLHAVREDAPSEPPAPPEAPSAPSEPSFEEPAFEEPSFEDPAWDAPLEEAPDLETEAEAATPFIESAVEPPAPAETAQAQPTPEPETEPAVKRSRMEILTMLERGEITPEEAKKSLGVAK